jgi:hypothetical protein
MKISREYCNAETEQESTWKIGFDSDGNAFRVDRPSTGDDWGEWRPIGHVSDHEGTNTKTFAELHGAFHKIT